MANIFETKCNSLGASNCFKQFIRPTELNDSILNERATNL